MKRGKNREKTYANKLKGRPNNEKTKETDQKKSSMMSRMKADEEK